MRIVFAQTRHFYASYVDFWRLVDAAGFEKCFIDEVDLADDQAVYIFTPMNGEVMHALEAQEIRRARVVWWNLERPGQDPTTSSSIDKLKGWIHAIWVSDKGCALDPRFAYVFMASHADIATRSTEREFDVCHLAYLWGRREVCVNEMRSRGLRIAPHAFDRVEQDNIVAKSRLILNLHQYADAPFVAPLRFAVAAAYARPIISERLGVAQLGPMWSGHIDAIPERIMQIITETSAHVLDAHGMNLHQRFCIETNFRNEVEKAVSELCR